MSNYTAGVGLILVFLLLIGCATQPTPMTETQIMDERVVPVSGKENWWYVRFRLTWPDGEEPPWYPDLLLADRVIGPILDTERDAISLWRFHRRAARDSAGRQFSFIFRATPATAARINARIAADPLLARLKKAETVQSVGYDDPENPRRPGIGDTSDKNWTSEMQVAWPYFIMGVSRLWLELIREIEEQGDWPEAIEARYAAIGKSLDERWQYEGGHALLHHLSAVFGYREVEVVSREVMRF